MKAEIMIPESMTTASIAFVLDVRNERETIIIGSYENIHDYLTKGKSSNDIQISSRKLGTLAEEMNELAMADNRMEEIIEAFNGLYNNISEAQGNKNAEQYISALNGIYSRAPRANMLRNYIIFFIFTNYMRIHKEQSGEHHIFSSETKKSAEKFSAEYNQIIKDMLTSYKNLPKIEESNVHYWDMSRSIGSDLTDYDARICHYNSDGESKVAYITDDSFIGLIQIYSDILNQCNKKVRNCRICHKLIIVERENDKCLCGNPECEKKYSADRNKVAQKKCRSNTINEIYNRFSNNSANFRRNFPNHLDFRQQIDDALKAERKVLLSEKKNLSESSPQDKIDEFQEKCNEAYYRLQELNEKLMEKR